jgi:hypothetical protein
MVFLAAPRRLHARPPDSTGFNHVRGGILEAAGPTARRSRTLRFSPTLDQSRLWCACCWHLSPKGQWSRRCQRRGSGASARTLEPARSATTRLRTCEVTTVSSPTLRTCREPSALQSATSADAAIARRLPLGRDRSTVALWGADPPSAASFQKGAAPSLRATAVRATVARHGLRLGSSSIVAANLRSTRPIARAGSEGSPSLVAVRFSVR